MECDDPLLKLKAERPPERWSLLHLGLNSIVGGAKVPSLQRQKEDFSMASKEGSAAFAKSIIEAAMNEGIVKPTVTAKELLSIIPKDSGIAPAGGVLAWSGYCLVYPGLKDQPS
jgi:hypothetical protein